MTVYRRGGTPLAPYEGSAPRMQASLARAGGLTQFGANLVELAPGEVSSDRHWHASEDEFLYVLEGEATVVEEDGPHRLGPGDIACWPAGEPNAHHVRNDSDAPVLFLVVGSNVDVDTVRYPDSGRTLYHEPPRWRMVADDGTVLGEGETG